MFDTEPLQYKSSLEGRLANSETPIETNEREETKAIIEKVQPIQYTCFDFESLE